MPIPFTKDCFLRRAKLVDYFIVYQKFNKNVIWTMPTDQKYLLLIQRLVEDCLAWHFRRLRIKFYLRRDRIWVECSEWESTLNESSHVFKIIVFVTANRFHHFENYNAVNLIYNKSNNEPNYKLNHWTHEIPTLSYYRLTTNVHKLPVFLKYYFMRLLRKSPHT